MIEAARTYIRELSFHLILPSVHMGNAPKPQLFRNEEEVHPITNDGVNLYGVTMEHPDGNRKWIVSFLPNSVQLEHHLDGLRYLKDISCCNVFSINYRGTSNSQNVHPTCFADLTADGCAAVDYLIYKKKVDPKDILVEGHSLGGAVAVQVARARQLPCLAHHTFTSIDAVRLSILRDTNRDVREARAQEIANIENGVDIEVPPPRSFIINLIQSVISVPIFCIDYFFNLLNVTSSIFQSIYALDPRSLLNHLIMLVKVAVGKPLFFIANIFLILISNCVGTRPALILCQYDILFFKDMRSSVEFVFESSLMHWITEKILNFIQMDVDNLEAWKQIRKPKLAFYTEGDMIIRPSANLGAALPHSERILMESPGVSHQTVPWALEEYEDSYTEALPYMFEETS